MFQNFFIFFPPNGGAGMSRNNCVGTDRFGNSAYYTKRFLDLFS
jgi:hypothetical protein